VGAALRRLDAELVRRGLARSREHARELIEGGQVAISGTTATKPATHVSEAAPIVVSDAAAADDYVSRGAHKLIGALEAFGDLEIAGRLALDAGASTGGFTEVLLRREVSGVLAVDVGYGQLAWRIREHPAVVVMERVNVRNLTPGDLPWRPNLVVADLSFISLATVLPALVSCATTDADFVLMVKPQFEVGRDQIGDGVVRDNALRSEAVRKIARASHELGLGVCGVVASPLPGPRGNVEYFLWLAAGAPALDEGALARAIEEGPA